MNSAVLPEDGAERPRAVTIIGRLWLIVAVFSLCKVLVNLSVWKVLEPDAPTLLGGAMTQMPMFLRPLLTHVAAFMTAQAVWWALVGIAAIGLLCLKRWGRVAIEGACWAVLVYAFGFGVFWVTVWPALPARGERVPAVAVSSQFLVGLFAGLGASAAVAAGVITMIVLLRRPRVREAFDQGGEFPRK